MRFCGSFEPRWPILSPVLTQKAVSDRLDDLAGTENRAQPNGLPSERIGIFRDGAGTVIPFGQVAVAWTPPVPLARRLAVEARYDLHRFLTPALRNEGFTNSRAIHRIAVDVRYTLSGAP